MNSYRPALATVDRASVPTNHHIDSDSDNDDHVPLGAMVNQLPPPAADSYNHQMPYHPELPQVFQPLSQQQQQTVYPPYQDLHYAQQHLAQQHVQQPGIYADYQQQLEMELEQQQQQFQQQYLMQYHQMQQEQVGGAQDWIHDGFNEQGAEPSHFPVGFQGAPHNPNFPHQYATIAPQPEVAAGVLYPHHAYPHSQPPAHVQRIQGRRPWVKGHEQPKPQLGAAHMSNGEASSSSASSDEDSSSDESAFGINSDEEIPIAAANSTPAPVSRNVSVSRNTPALGPRSRIPSIATSRQRHTNAVPKASSGDCSENEDEDDDDVPLSVISSNSTYNSSVVAAIRRTKSVAPSALSPRPKAGETAEPTIPESITRGVVKARSLLVSPRAKGSATHTQDQSQGSSGDDEDAPLDQLKVNLASGARAVPSNLSALGSRTHSAASLRRAMTVTAGEGSTVLAEPSNNASSYDDASICKTRVADSIQEGSHKFPLLVNDNDNDNVASGTITDTCGNVHNSCSSVDTIDKPQPMPSTAPSSPTQSCSSASISTSGSSAGRDCHSQVPDSPLPLSPPPKEDKIKKVSNYLPTGTALPAFPFKRRAAKARAAVQYVALADIMENAERAQGLRSDDGDAANDCDRLQRKQSEKATAGNNSNPLGDQSDARSVASFGTTSSSGGTLMEVLRAGPVELLTASTEHSGSKATVERVVPEDYGDIDQLLVDLDGIRNGSLAARRRFSMALMRRSLAVSNGLIEPVDYSDQNEDNENMVADATTRSIIEFKPLEVGGVSADFDSPLGADLGLSDAILTVLSAAGEDKDDDDSQPLNVLAARNSVAGENGLQTLALNNKAPASPPRLALQFGAQPEALPLEPPPPPAELTRTQKIHKALEQLELLNVRKISIRIYVQDAQRYYTFSLTEFTTSEMIINDMKRSGIIDAEKSNWALFELVDHFGVERPLNHFENLMCVVESWEPRSNNYIIAKGFSQQAALTLLGGVHPGEHAIQGMLYYRIKKNKWQKGVFRLHGYNLLFIKDSRGKSKKEAHYLTLTNNDVYTPFKPLRGAPTRYLFGLKSEMPIQMFEKPDEDYVKWFAVQTLDSLRQWLQILRFSKNQIKFCQVLERRVAETCKLKPNNQNTPFKPLVDLNTDKNDDDDENDKESVEDQVKHNADIAADIVLTLSRTATSTKYDPLALLKVVEQSGIDVSDFNILGAESGQGSDNHDNNDEQTAEGLFQPGSLLSKPKKSALENDAHMEPEIEMFAKGSLLSQTRESKAMTASRAMQDVMAHDGNVFTQGSLLQVTNETKLRPPHMGGAAHVLNPQFPLVQLEDPEFARPGGLIHQAMSTNINHEAVYAAHYNVQPDPPIFGGLLADHAQQTVPQHPDIYHHSRSNGQHAQQY